MKKIKRKIHTFNTPKKQKKREMKQNIRGQTENNNKKTG